MLTRLLDLRRLRERTLRAQLDVVLAQKTALQARQHDLLVQRSGLRYAWRRCSMAESVLDQAAWRQFKAALADYSQRDAELGYQLDVHEAEALRLQERESALQCQLRRALVGQQTLKALLA